MGRRAAHQLILAGALALCLPVRFAEACAIDDVPSIEANGTLARVNWLEPTVSSITRWAPFEFATIFYAGEVVALSEDQRKLARSLPPDIVRGHWVWRFGDGTSARGRTVKHVYRKPGNYLVTVAMPLPHSHGLFVFDAVIIRFRPR
jgi:hypothetical protein